MIPPPGPKPARGRCLRVASKRHPLALTAATIPPTTGPRYSSVLQFPDGTLGVQWDDGSGGPVSHAGLTNETFVRLQLARR